MRLAERAARQCRRIPEHRRCDYLKLHYNQEERRKEGHKDGDPLHLMLLDIPTFLELDPAEDGVEPVRLADARHDEVGLVPRRVSGHHPCR